VSSFFQRELRESRIDFTEDRHGNLIASCGKGKPALAFVAHMDHPGFEVTGVVGTTARAAWYGGVAAGYFKGARVVIHNRRSGAPRSRAVIQNIVKNAQGRVEKMVLRTERKVEAGDFGTWDLVRFRRRDERIEAKAADDLVGCAAILSVLKALKAHRRHRKIVGVFTRAEEQGFIGTLEMIRDSTLPPRTKIISVETSKALPGAALGAGPVIRLGDRTSMFHPDVIAFMDHLARSLAKKNRSFRFQRRVMDGGTCEATPYQLTGYLTGGVAIPLHNYHNQGRRRIGPEAVDLRDVAGAARLLYEIAVKIDAFDAPVDEIRKRMENNWQKYRMRLSARKRPRQG
jgi:endoglucanase